MFKIAEVREIFQLFKDSSAQEFVFEQDSMKIALRKERVTSEMDSSLVTSASAVAVQERPNVVAVENLTEMVEEETTNVQEVTSPMVGTFYLRGNPEAAPYVEIGKAVQPDDVVCIVEAMKLFNEIEAGVHGEIIDILVQDGEVVQFGQPLFRIKEW